MRIIYLLSYAILSALLLCNCSNNSCEYSIDRFDKSLMDVIGNNSDSLAISVFSEKYNQLLSIYYSGILNGNGKNLNARDKIAYIDSVINSTPFKRLYDEVSLVFDDMNSEEILLCKAIKRYKVIFPELPIPKVYSHISPFGYSVITSDSIISISLDNYMGDSYAGYKGVFHNYQLKKKLRERIIPDIFRAWLYANYNSNVKTLIDGMIYEGAVIYAISHILPDFNIKLIMGYSDNEIEWCNKNEESVWNSILKSGNLYSTDDLIYTKYMNEAPFCAIFGKDAPAELGKWIGYKVVSDFIDDNNISVISSILNGKISVTDILKSYKR